MGRYCYTDEMDKNHGKKGESLFITVTRIYNTF